jgi:hypothetical protein
MNSSFSRPGSVIASYTLEFSDASKPINNTVINGLLQVAAANNNFGNLTVDPASIVHSGKINAFNIS